MGGGEGSVIVLAFPCAADLLERHFVEAINVACSFRILPLIPRTLIGIFE
jgi:hypothetical protein